MFVAFPMPVRETILKPSQQANAERVTEQQTQRFSEEVVMARDTLRQTANVLFALTQIAAAILVNTGVTGPSVGAISDQYPTYVVPAGYAFSIWSLIYALSLGYAVYQALPQHRNDDLLRRIGWFTASAFLSASVWVFVFQSAQFILSVLVILWLLVSLIGVVAQTYTHSALLSRAEQWLVWVAFSIFLGWVTVATLANVAQTLVALDWNGWGIEATTWGVIMLLVAGAIASIVTAFTGANVPYALAVLWAFIAVAVNGFNDSPPASAAITIVAAAVALAVVVTLFASRLRMRRA